MFRAAFGRILKSLGVVARSGQKSSPARRRLLVEPLQERALLATIPAGFTETAVATALSSPTSLDISHDGRVFVAQQSGVIRVIENDALVSTPFGSLQVDSKGERGLLGITLDPDFDQNNYLYVYYTATSPNSHTRVSRLTANGNRVVAGSEEALIDLPGFSSTAIWRMGGAIHFGPDGKLYVAAGDQQNTSNPQSLDNPFGKILRINSDGSIPTDNPFYGSTTGVNRAIWAYGLRNPYTTAFQPGTGRFFINDVGDDSWEEINEGASGRNFGWPTTEGRFAQSQHPGFTQPVHTYSHDHGSAITGGAFYNPETGQFPTQYVGDYFFADFSEGEIRVLDLATMNVRVFASGASFPTNLAVSHSGSMYYVSRGIGTGVPGTGTGQVFKIQHATNAAPTITTPPANALVAVGGNAKFNVAVTGNSPFTYQWQREKVDIPGATGATFNLTGAALADSGAKFRVVVTNAFGTATSGEAVLSVTTDSPPVPTITLPPGGATYIAGQSIHVFGSGSDPEDGTLSESQMIWQVDFHHDTHAHPFIPPTGGVSELDFTIPTAGETAHDVWYRVYLTVIDSLGLSTTTSRDILPITGNISLQTNIAGLMLSLDGQPQTAPHHVVGVVGGQRTLSAPPSQTVNGVTYLFSGWSDGGAASHTISFPATNTTYTATYSVASVTYVSDMGFASTPTNGWGPVERNRSNGERAANDGKMLSIHGVTYDKGLGVHAASSVTINLGGRFSRFLSDIGLDDEAMGSGSVRFQVFGDGAPLYDSGLVIGTTPTKSVDIGVVGIQQLRLVVSDFGDGTSFDHADWARARLLAVSTSTNPPPPALVSFAEPVSYATGVNTHGVVAADFNGDGDLDLAAAISGPSKVSVLLGNGDGTFQPAVHYATGSQPKSVAAGDLNGDGKADLVTANQGSSTVTVLLNLGDGTFAAGVNYAATTGAHEVALADLNGDGRTDIAEVGWGSRNVRVFFNTGNGTFTRTANFVAGTGPHSVVAADLNRDGRPDLATANRKGNNVAVLINRGSGRFASAVLYAVGSQPHSLRAGDLTGDGRLDLVTANDGGNSVSLLVGTGLGRFARAVTMGTGAVPKGIELGDVNGDGRLDILSANTAGNYPNNNNPGGNTVSVLINLGNGKFSKPQTIITGRTPFCIELADFDDDGDLDVATANWHSNDVTVVLNKRKDGPTGG